MQRSSRQWFLSLLVSVPICVHLKSGVIFPHLVHPDGRAQHRRLRSHSGSRAQTRRGILSARGRIFTGNPSRIGRHQPWFSRDPCQPVPCVLWIRHPAAAPPAVRSARLPFGICWISALTARIAIAPCATWDYPCGAPSTKPQPFGRQSKSSCTSRDGWESRLPTRRSKPFATGTTLPSSIWSRPWSDPTPPAHPLRPGTRSLRQSVPSSQMLRPRRAIPFHCSMPLVPGEGPEATDPVKVIRGGAMRHASPGARAVALFLTIGTTVTARTHDASMSGS